MADQEYNIKFNIKSGKAEKGLTSIKKKATGAGAAAGGAGVAGATGFSAMRTAVLANIPALGALKTALISTGVGAIVVAIGTLIAFLAMAANKAKEFEGAVAGLNAISGSTAEELEVLTDQAKELGSTTIFTASEVIQLQTELAKLGFTANQLGDATPSILSMAAALDVSLAEAAEFAGSTVRAFGLTTAETKRVVDVMAKSAVTSAQDFNTLRESFKLAAPMSRALGVTIEETAGLLGVLANNGLKGSIAGTGLAKTFIQLNKKGISLDEALQRVARSSDQLNTAVDLVGIVGAKSLLTLANNIPMIAELTESMNTAEGAADNLAKVRYDSLIGDQKSLSSAWEGFLLTIEDGTGPLNNIRRMLTQGLTLAIRGVTSAVEFMGFMIGDIWETSKMSTIAAKNILVGAFKIMGSGIAIFANNAMLAIAKIPIIGKAVDEDKVRENIEKAKLLLQEGQTQIEQGVTNTQQAFMLSRTRLARFNVAQKGAAERRQEEKNRQELEIQLDEYEEEDKEAEAKRLEQREKDLEALNKLEKKYRQLNEDEDDISNVEKVERKRERALLELDALVLSETEKEEAKLAIEAYYKELREEAVITDEEEAKAKKDQIETDDQAYRDRVAQAEENLEKVKRDQRNETFDDAIRLAGEESKLGKALMIAKQIFAFKDKMLGRKKTIASAQENLKQAKGSVTKGGVDAASGIPATASIGFPQNIPMLIAYAAQAIAFIAAVKGAFGKSKRAVQEVGGSVGADPQLSAPSVPTASIPTTAAVSPMTTVGSSGMNAIAEAVSGANPVQAYVVSQDVTTAQSLENNIISSGSIG